jgi:hypothetical protein
MTDEELRNEYLKTLSDEELTQLYKDANLRDAQAAKAPFVEGAKQFGAGAIDTGAQIADYARRAGMFAQLAPKIMGGVGPDKIEPPSSLLQQWQQKVPPPTDQFSVPAYARAAGQGAPLGLLGPGGGGTPWLANQAAKVLAYGVGPALSGKAASDISQKLAPGDTTHIPYVGDVPTSEIAGMTGSMFTPGAGRITPSFQRDPLRSEHARILEREGIQPTVGQEFGRQQQINREIHSDPGINDRQAGALTRAYTRRVNPNAPVDRLTRGPGGYFDTESNRINSTINNLSNHVFADPRIMGTGITNTQLYNDLTQISQRARAAGRPELVDEALNSFRNINNEWQPTAGPTHNPTMPDERLHDALFRNTPIGPPYPSMSPTGGRRTMTARQYQQLRDTLHSQANLTQNDPVRTQFYHNIADSLDNSVEATLRDQGNLPLGALWNLTRTQQRNLAVIENAAGQLPAGPLRLDPDTMARAEHNVTGLRPYLRGTEPFSELTEASGHVLRPLTEQPIAPEPGRFERAMSHIPLGPSIYRQISPIAGLVTGGISHHFGGGFWEPFLGGMFAAQAAREPSLLHTQGTVGAGPIQQAYGRNQILPMRPQDENMRRLHAIGRALTMPQQPYPQQQQQPIGLPVQPPIQ